MKTVLFGSGMIYDYSFYKKYLSGDIKIICCDGGMEHAKKLDVKPDYILGDFDSVSMSTLNFFKEMEIETIKFPVEKDYTDMEAGIDFALKLFPSEILIFGGVGNRFDHTFANVSILLKALLNNTPAKLINENNEIQVFDKCIEIHGRKGDLLSLLPLSLTVTGIRTEGLKYPLSNAKMTMGESIGVSNCLTEETAFISIQDGYMLAIKSSD